MLTQQTTDFIKIKKQINDLITINFKDISKFVYDDKRNCFDFGSFFVKELQVKISIDYFEEIDNLRFRIQYRVPREPRYDYSNSVWINVNDFKTMSKKQLHQQIKKIQNAAHEALMDQCKYVLYTMM